jgi:hypothetical protein
MLMVDKLITLNESVVKTKFVIPENCIFNNNSSLVESGLIENMAQTCSIILGCSYFFDDDGLVENNSDVIGFISSIKKLQIYKLPIVNDILTTTGEIISRIDGKDYSICEMKGNIVSNDKIILDCTLNLFIKKNNHES